MMLKRSFSVYKESFQHEKTRWNSLKKKREPDVLIRIAWGLTSFAIVAAYTTLFLHFYLLRN